MEVKYKNCTIEAFRDKPITGGDKLLFYSVFDDNNGLEVASGFSEGMDTVRDWIKDLKLTVDDYRLNPIKYEEE